jgi:peptidoglycan pentaglycine glycine transferase (the first glycine)
MSIEIRLLNDIALESPLGIQWETLVQNSAVSGFMQSLHWRGFKQRQGLSSLHLGLFRGGDLIGGVLFYYAKNSKGATILIAPEGPVLPWEDEDLSGQCMDRIVEFVQERSSEYGVIGIRIEPRLSPPGSPALLTFGRAPIDLLPIETLYVDLSKDHEQILLGMKPKGRYNIRLSKRRGVSVHSSTNLVDVKLFYALVKETAARDGFFLEPYIFFEALAETLFSSGTAQLFFAEHEGDPLGALLLITYGKRATYLYGGISNAKRNMMAGYALQWRAMKQAKLAGCTEYDFYGYDRFMAPDNRYAKFSKFKSQFGGEPRRFIGANEYFFTEQLADVVIKALKEIHVRG